MSTTKKARPLVNPFNLAYGTALFLVGYMIGSGRCGGALVAVALAGLAYAFDRKASTSQSKEPS